MKSFFVITNPIKDRDYSIAKSVIEYLEIHGGKCRFAPCDIDENNPDKTEYINSDIIPSDVEGIIVLGETEPFFRLQEIPSKGRFRLSE